VVHVDLLAKVLSVSVQRLWKRALDRGYRTITGEDPRLGWLLRTTGTHSHQSRRKE
jgi:hypothetical protein